MFDLNPTLPSSDPFAFQMNLRPNPNPGTMPPPHTHTLPALHQNLLKQNQAILGPGAHHKRSNLAPQMFHRCRTPGIAKHIPACRNIWAARGQTVRVLGQRLLPHTLRQSTSSTRVALAKAGLPSRLNGRVETRSASNPAPGSAGKALFPDQPPTSGPPPTPHPCQNGFCGPPHRPPQ